MRGVDVVHSLAGNYLGWAAREAAHERGIPFVSTPFVHPLQWGDGPNDVAYYRQADAVTAHPFICPALTDLNDGFAKLGPAMQKAAIPPLDGPAI